ncbi:carotenoid 1,2-hydratase [Vibrio brasiliensis]|uniref:lipocalin-like domain-containing protein n=1 Tax=Vibrio brasiliensis TaxID=170652 RepID=UPI001EFEEEAD|nr:lipocalin-like domain-containing protein [Vibrio brasiliensis]MCG9751698.1 carotenoid 1,2-hydratase [Vibrio brasiliensis]MCG9782471.1 carotenoid 1,2-hydratase [Vibrio brasiliensis]
MNRVLPSAILILTTLYLLGCEETTPQNMGSLLGDSQVNVQDFTPVLPGVGISFPADHKAHSDFRHEWWYLTANLTDEEGNALGVQWTQFRFAASPTQNDAEENKTVWQSQQIYMAHSAVTAQDTHYADEKWSRDQRQLAGVDVSPFRVYLDDWQWTSSSADLFPATLNVDSQQFGYSLTLTSSAPYQKQGQQGFSTKSADGLVASYYYSQPFIDVSGQVTIDGRTHQVTGKGWIDREWSSQFLLDSQQGWDWFALRLNEETSLVVFQLRDSKTGQANYSHAKLMYKDGSGETVEQQDIRLQATKQTQVEGRPYPTEWQLSLPDHQIELTVSALNPNARMPLSVPYWEGPVIIKGSHSGSGYMELTGY